MLIAYAAASRQTRLFATFTCWRSPSSNVVLGATPEGVFRHSSRPARCTRMRVHWTKKRDGGQSKKSTEAPTAVRDKTFAVEKEEREQVYIHTQTHNHNEA